MKTFLSFICAMLISCASLLNAQNPTHSLTVTGTLINPKTSMDDYTIQLCQAGGNDSQQLELIKPDADGDFVITVFSERAVRIEVLDKKKNIVFRRTLPTSSDNSKVDLKEIDLSKERTRK